ncbi:MAG: reverse transcriptase family protein [Planctomycetota bacterium]
MLANTAAAVFLVILAVFGLVLLLWLAYVLLDGLGERGLIAGPRPTPKRRTPRRQPRSKHNLAQLTWRLRTTPDELQAIPCRYRNSRIPKRTSGHRTLYIPDEPLKAIQRSLLGRVLRNLKVHPAATGFEPGLSIAHNAAFHAGQAVVIKLDLKDFFPSTTADRVNHYFRLIGWDAEAAALLTRLTTYEDGLPQGAPTSPRLANLVNYVLDAQIERYVRKHHGTYTRYADDITVSYPEDWPKYVRGTIQKVRRVAKAHGYTVHTRGKLRVLRQHQQQRVTGLVVNNRVNLPRQKRRWLRAVEHRLRTTGEASLTPEQLDGWHALQAMIAQHRDA